MTPNEMEIAKKEIVQTKQAARDFWMIMVINTPIVSKKDQIWEAIKNSAEYLEQQSIEEQLKCIDLMSLQEVMRLCSRSLFLFKSVIRKYSAEATWKSSVDIPQKKENPG